MERDPELGRQKYTVDDRETAIHTKEQGKIEKIWEVDQNSRSNSNRLPPGLGLQVPSPVLRTRT